MKEFNRLVERFSIYLVERCNYKTGSVKGFNLHWNRLREFMFKNNYSFYNDEVLAAALKEFCGDKPITAYTPDDRPIYNALDYLLEFQKKGTFTKRFYVAKKDFTLKGPIGKIYQSFINYKINEEGCSHGTMGNYRSQLLALNLYCIKENVESIKEVDLSFLLKFIKLPASEGGVPAKLFISTLKGLVRYLYRNEFIEHDFSSRIPARRNIRQSKLPSVYTAEEIEQIIAAVYRGSNTGKRDYAMILIAARLGLRSSDIVSLKFENIKWESNTIEIVQEKTKRGLVLPLTSEVGNAILEYLQFVRKESKEPYIFLSELPPFGILRDQAVRKAVVTALAATNIDTRFRKVGGHALRHSLVARLQENNIKLPLISGVLGHADSNSTRYYMRVDTTSLSKCALEVPLVNPDFYIQKGKYFYA